MTVLQSFNLFAGREDVPTASERGHSCPQQHGAWERCTSLRECQRVCELLRTGMSARRSLAGFVSLRPPCLCVALKAAKARPLRQDYEQNCFILKNRPALMVLPAPSTLHPLCPSDTDKEMENRNVFVLNFPVHHPVLRCTSGGCPKPGGAFTRLPRSLSAPGFAGAGRRPALA